MAVIDRLIGQAPSRNTVVDLWYARIIAATCASIENCCYIEIGVNVEALSMRVVAPYTAESHGCDLKPECDVPKGTRLWVMSSAEFLRSYDGSDPDVVFIDADHEYEAVKADFQGVVARWPRALAFLHDGWAAVPPDYVWSERDWGRVPDCGDVWKLREELEASPDHETFTWRHDPGLTVVRGR